MLLLLLEIILNLVEVDPYSTHLSLLLGFGFDSQNICPTNDGSY